MITFGQYLLEVQNVSDPQMAGQAQQMGQAAQPQPGQPQQQPGQAAPRPGSTDPEVEAKPYIDYITKALQSGQLTQSGLSYLARSVQHMNQQDMAQGGAGAQAQ